MSWARTTVDRSAPSCVTVGVEKIGVGVEVGVGIAGKSYRRGASPQGTWNALQVPWCFW